ncbi:MAG: DegT/DnrJ/EryC1/StrS family aminotransferase [Kiritimatiellae bacterium]|nr:DegT/DnrJ/EryC1/StrS family aminotransferase [Kiritimatiellia bacterium]
MGKKRKVPFGTINIPKEAIRLVTMALKSGRVSSGRMVRQFERQFATLVGVKHAVAVSTGTDADTLAMAVLYDFGARRGDEIIVPALSFVATGNSVLHAGFKPVFVDINHETLNINPTLIERSITGRTIAIMPVHLMGKPAAMDTIMAIAREHKLRVIEDAAEAYGASYHDKAVGTIGDMGAFSTYVAHIITTIEGGVITTGNAEVAEILRSLRSHGRACKCESCKLNVSGGYCDKRFSKPKLGDIRFIFERIGYSCKMNELEAAVGIANLGNYDAILSKRRNNLHTLMKGVQGMGPYLSTFIEEKYEKIGPHAMPVLVSPNAPFSRNDIVLYLEKCGIETRSLFQSMPTQCPGFEFLGYKIGQFPEAEYVGKSGFHIGVHQDLNNDDVTYVLNCLEEFVHHQKS